MKKIIISLIVGAVALSAQAALAASSADGGGVSSGDINGGSGGPRPVITPIDPAPTPTPSSDNNGGSKPISVPSAAYGGVTTVHVPVDLRLVDPAYRYDTPVVPSALAKAKYANGTLLRGPNWKVYVVNKNKLTRVATVSQLRNYKGKKIINISSQTMEAYLNS